MFYSRMEPCIVCYQRTIVLCSYYNGTHKTHYKVNQAIFCKKRKCLWLIVWMLIVRM